MAVATIPAVNRRRRCRLWVKSGRAEVQYAGVTTGKKWEIKWEVSCFLPGYDVID